MTPEVCPNCGQDVPARAKACPHCGSCEETGWSKEAVEDPLGLDQGNFNYQEFVEKEFSGESPKPQGLSKLWWIVAIILLIALAFMLLRH